MTSAIPIVESIPTDVASSRVAIAYVVHWIFLGVVSLLVLFCCRYYGSADFNGS